MRRRKRRAGVLQRVLYLAFRTTIEASFNDIMIDGGATGRVRAFVRILQYLRPV